MCPFQFFSDHKFDAKVGENGTLNYKRLETDYEFTSPSYLIELLLNDCTWLTNTAFKLSKSSTVFSQIMRLEGLPSNKHDLDIIPSSICVCTAPRDFNCTSHDLGVTIQSTVAALLQQTKYLSHIPAMDVTSIITLCGL